MLQHVPTHEGKDLYVAHTSHRLRKRDDSDINIIPDFPECAVSCQESGECPEARITYPSEGLCRMRSSSVWV